MSERMRGTDRNTIDIIAFAKYVLKKWYFIVLGIILSIAVSIPIIMQMITPSYTCEAKYYLTTSQEIGSYGALQATASVMEDYKAMIQSRTVAKRAINRDKLDIDEDSILKMISVTNPEDTHLLVVELKAKDRNQAEEVMNALSYQIIEYVPSILVGSSLEVFEEPTSSVNEVIVERIMALIIIIIAAALILIMVLLFMFMNKATVDDPEVVSEEFNGISTFVIPRGNRKFLFNNEKKQVELQNSIDAAIDEILYSIAFDKKQSRIIMITSPVSGEGKAFLASKLYEKLQSEKIESAIVDDDLLKIGLKENNEDVSGDSKGILSLVKNGEVEKTLDHLKESSRVIIIDALPILKTSKALILTEYCDQIVLVAQCGKTLMSDIKKSVRKLNDNGVDVNAIVLNQYT